MEERTVREHNNNGGRSTVEGERRNTVNPKSFFKK